MIRKFLSSAPQPGKLRLVSDRSAELISQRGAQHPGGRPSRSGTGPAGDSGVGAGHGAGVGTGCGARVGTGRGADCNADCGETCYTEFGAAEGIPFVPPRRGLLADERGAITAEYAIVIMAAVAFAGLLVAIMRSSEIRAMLVQLVENALGAAG